MAISEVDLAFIASLGPMPRRVCDLGDQELQCHDEASFDRLGFKAPKRGMARDFWKAIGSEHLALDIVGEATRFDLNYDKTPADCGTFDLVTNCGTTEHVLNQFNCFNVIHDLTKVGGVMYHCVPVGGHQSHGMFVYTLRFFELLARENGYRVLKSDLSTSEVN